MKRLVCLVILALAAQPAFSASVEERLKKIEGLISSQALVNTSDQLEQLMDEFRQLRGDLELQQRELRELKQQQKKLYEDMDARSRATQLEMQQLRNQMVALQSQPQQASETENANKASAANTTQPAQIVGKPQFKSDVEAYQYGFTLLKEGRYEQARESFKQLIADYPKGQYADNAQYWVGEINYVTRNFEQALSDFIKIKELYPESAKLPDARLKIGYVYYELGQWQNSRKALQEVVDLHPSSTPAGLAKNRLQRLKKEGR